MMSKSAIASSSTRAAMGAAKDASTGRYAMNASSSGVRGAYNAPIGRCNSARPSRSVSFIAADEMPITFPCSHGYTFLDPK
ncbi:hypothetical protein PF005_g383 [Phytophthora fragariae]|uniref:Uncharacterized protein n=1 Tax=Phytophthora fragariae TaxID=53985 RepID=A0A6A3ZNC8_9STRA|nr:hypothetical protein PF005_g383 [Phytophthora fragariae]KAE9258250.1 hypothetical protein PF002_g275 [Phytophthora fragariae]